MSKKWKKGEVKRTCVVKSNEIIFIFKTHDRKRKGQRHTASKQEHDGNNDRQTMQ